jgi:hypothetical protein
MHGEDLSAVEINVPGQVCGRFKRIGSIGIQARGISPFTVVIVEVELDRYALGYTSIA